MTDTTMSKRGVIWCVVALLAIAIIALALSSNRGNWVDWLKLSTTVGDDGDDHGHGGDSGSTDQVSITPQARKTIGLVVGAVKLEPYVQEIEIPGVVVHQPGRSRMLVPAPLTGVVSRIDAFEGETVVTGQELFRVHLMHAELVEAQGEFLKAVEQRNVVEQEIARLEAIAPGVIAGKTLIERKYELQKLQAATGALRERLLLHGLSEEQLDEVVKHHRLISGMTVVVPGARVHMKAAEISRATTSDPHPYQIERLNVEQGQHITAGDALCVLSDISELYIEGRAFEQDIGLLTDARENGLKVTAVFEGNQQQPIVVPELSIVYLSGVIDPDSRTMRFFVALPNQQIRETEHQGRRYVDWRFRPGQRVTLRVPGKTITKGIVLPVDAVIEDGAESYVFKGNAGSFKRQAVHVLYRDRKSVVLENDGSIYDGDQVAMHGAHMLFLELKKKSGGAVDPHAGHSH